MSMMKGSSDTDNVVFHAGFPNAAEDGKLGSLSLDKLIVKHRASTFFWRLETEVKELSWPAGSIAVVDRALDPKNGSLVIVSTGDDFVICRYVKNNFERLDGATFDTEPILWGVATYAVQPLFKQ